MRRRRLFVTALILFLFSAATAAETASAGVFDRIKDIYETPDRLEELQQSYDASIKAMEGQLEESRKQAQELIDRQDELQRSNEAYREQNEALAQENERLLRQMDELERSRESMYRKAAVAGGIVVALIAAYALSVRIWRYMVWRKQGRESRRHADDGRGVTLP
ncbi:hypothetical protein RB620_26235 [Paenibacillus sp. LHD-117]|uniref:hypothetical protein n=1 Tax=Paenibacillus sp. LHD-117 TaxID=3071412 RepID=UPI0027DF09B6|nr:hypothetical protein [Paenibacillus sp. LHD-117]MDQ6422932.1 hypothetical protein [Paenibacillus sp. LHD-117]